MMSKMTDYIPQLFIHFEAGMNTQVMDASHMSHGWSCSLYILLLETLAFILFNFFHVSTSIYVASIVYQYLWFTFL